MTSTKQLFSLQELDLVLDQLQEETYRAEKELSAGVAIEHLEMALEEVVTLLQEVKELQQVQRLDAESQRERAARLEEQLYGGALTNPRELESLEQEVSHTREMLQDREAKLQELSLKAEEAQERQAELEKELADAKSSWEVREVGLREELKRLAENHDAISAQRKSLAETLEPAALRQYEGLRRTKAGVAVAKVERGLCQSCRMSLPTHHLQRVKSGRETVLCSSCGRMLVIS